MMGVSARGSSRLQKFFKISPLLGEGGGDRGYSQKIGPGKGASKDKRSELA